MNGVLDSQTSGNGWNTRRRMLHERIEQLILPDPSPRVQAAVFDGLEQQMSDAENELGQLLDELGKIFVFISSEDVKTFLRGHRGIPSLLIEAAPHFRKAFGNAPLALDVVTEEGNPRTIYALAQWGEERREAKKALRDFDEQWWISNLQKAGGKVVFDYELVR